MEKFCSPAEEPKNSGVYPRKTEVWVSGAEIQTLAVDTRTAVWVYTAEENFKSFWEKLEFFLECWGGLSASSVSNPAVRFVCPRSIGETDGIVAKLWRCRIASEAPTARHPAKLVANRGG